MKCKCIICKKELNTTEAYCYEKLVGDKAKRFYFCSESEAKEYYAKIEQSKIDMRFMDETINYIIGYENKNTLLFGEEKKWLKDKNNIRAIDNNKEWLRNIMSSKGFNSEYAMIKYLTTVINNNLTDWVEKVIADNKVEEYLETGETISGYEEVKPVHRKSKRRCLADYKEE